MRKNIIRIIIVAAVLAPTVFLTHWWYRYYADKSKAHSAPASNKSIHGIAVSGIIRCKQRSAIAAEIIAAITALPVEEGQKVSEGDVLAVLDSRIAVAETAKARARVDLVEHSLAELEAGPRKQEITKAGEMVTRAKSALAYAMTEHAELQGHVVASPREVRQAANKVTEAQSDLAWAQTNLELLHAGTRAEQLARAKAEVDLAKADLSRCEAVEHKYKLRATHDGIVTVRYVSVGEVVSPGQVLMRLHNIQTVEIRAQVQESQLSGVEIGSEAMVMIDAYPDSPLKAVVQKILPRVDAEQGTITVLLKLVGTPGVTLMDGMAADIAIYSREK